MIPDLFMLVLAAATCASAFPALERRTVQQLDQAAFEEAHPRDNGATRAFSSTQIKTSNGQCLFVDKLSGDFRANLTPVQVVACDNSDGQKWDIITKGAHNDRAGNMLVVSTLTQACLNFDPRRAAGNQVLLFSCGGRADGEGLVADSQLFPFAGGSGPLSLAPGGAAGTCLTVKGKVLDQAGCDKGDANQSFTFGTGGVAAPESTLSAVSALSTPTPAPALTPPTTPSITTEVEGPAQNTLTPSPTPSPTPEVSVPATGNAPTSAIAVSRAGLVLNTQAAAEANVRDDTASRAFSSASVKSADGQCLFIDPTAGDFRENLIPVQLKACDGSAGEKFDIITKGKHIDVADSMLVVSTVTQGCLNFDPRRAAGDQVILFSCGGRADGEGLVTDSQLFGFKGDSSTQLAPNSGKGATCLVPSGNVLGSAACDGSQGQLFTIA
ncbi:hypothetical protein MMC07_005364 [Pseudocyphellaria aurata]|nr:hypothetical protein [Pseudocyphellaria aurata]